VRSWYGEGGAGLTFGFHWLFMDWFIPQYPSFMFGIWHEGGWQKERFGSTESMVGWYMEVPDLVGFCIWLIRAKFLLYL